MKYLKKGIIDTTDINMTMMVRIFIVVVVISAAAVVFWKSRAISDINLINTVINEMRQNRDPDGYKASTDYSAVLIKSGAIPTNVTIANGQIYNGAGQPLQITGAGVGFKVASPGLSDKECMNLATKLGTADMASTQINGQTFTSAVTSLNANNACTGDSNSVTFNTRY